MEPEDFPIQTQRMSNWCWAACTSSISTYYQDAVIPSQEQLEADLNDKPVCATGPLTEYCNDTCDLEVSLMHIGHLGTPYGDIVPPETLLEELAAGRPVCCQMNLPVIGGHAVIVVGARQNEGETVLQVADPASGEINPMAYADFRDNYLAGGGTWDRTYTTT